MHEEAVEPQEQEQLIVEPQDVVQEMAEDVESIAQDQVKQVPLSALQKERQKRYEEKARREFLEKELENERQRNTKVSVPPEEDNSKYESATREDLIRAQEQAVRAVEERRWIKENPEKFEKVNDNLPQFLKQRPNLASAINYASNRYEEAYALMEALTPKQQQQIKTAASPKKEAPNAPGGVPKAAALNQAVDVMSMSDAEFSAWRHAQKKRR